MGIARARARAYADTELLRSIKSFHIKIIVKQGNRFYANT